MALLSLANRWATWNIKRNEIYSDIFKLKNVRMCVKQVNWLRVCSNWNKTAGARQLMWSANCAPARRLKKGSVHSSAEPMGAHWGEEMAHKWDIETKHAWTYSNSKIQNWTRKNVVLFKPRQNCWSRGRYNILSTDIMAQWIFSLVVMMVEVGNVRWAGVDGLPFRSLVSSSEAATSDMPIFWVCANRNQRLWAHLYPSMLRESRERSIKHQSSQNSLTHWVSDAALIGGMAEKGDVIVTMNGG